ncbi:MAG: alpha-amylase [Rubrivivax sp.]|nr:alpha-amylase [Rubrivivax sp.]
MKPLLIALVLAMPVAAQEPDRSPVAMRDPGSTLAPDWHRGAFMEIFVRAWKDSDGDGIGDLRGLTQTLPYLQSLGIRGLWLMPITANADGDHGYATTDFRTIAPEYGTLADFDTFIARAHALGIGVIMDYVINHSAAQHPWFVASRTDPAHPKRDWYVWAKDAPTGWDIWGKNPWYHAATRPWEFVGDPKTIPPPAPGAQQHYFGTFGPHMPDFNLQNPQVWQYHEDSLRFWLNRGLDGFRLDAVPHMVETDAVRWNDQPQSRQLTKRLQDLIRSYRHRWAVCEATAEPQAYADDSVCGAAFAFGYVQHYIQAAQGDVASVQALTAPHPRRSERLATMLSNHDIFAGQRLWDQVQGDEARYKLAAAAYLLQPGTPFVYYGEEIGLAGLPGLDGDLPIRGPMSWTADGGFSSGTPFRPPAPNRGTHNAAAQQRDPDSLWHFYRAMISLRNTHASIRRGTWRHGRSDGGVAQWQRVVEGEADGDHTLVLINHGTAGATVLADALPPGSRLQASWPRWAAPARADAQGQARLHLAPQSVRVYRVLVR